MLTKVISQMMMRRTRPTARDLPSQILGVAHSSSLHYLDLWQCKLHSPRVYHKYLRAQASSYRLFFPSRLLSNGSRSFSRKIATYSRHALTNFFVLSNIHPVFGGPREMVRASRCLGIVFFQPGRPATLSAAEPLLCDLHLADKSFAHTRISSATNLFRAARAKNLSYRCAQPQSGRRTNDPWGELAAPCVAIT